MMKPLFGAIETGGTKCNLMIARSPEEVLEETRIPTTTPEETVGKAISFFEPYVQRGELSALGVGAFGPLDLDPGSATYGYVLPTPKPGWSMTDLYGTLQRTLDIPVVFETDVNAAAYGEHAWVDANRLLDPFVYITVGTGVGVGTLVNGKLLHGLLHSEAGHLFLPKDPNHDPFEGICPFHKNCLEGLACGPAMQKRWGKPAEHLPDDHPAWELEAEYLAYGIANLIFTLSPQRIVLGGGVMQRAGLLKKVQQKVKSFLNGYYQNPLILDHIEDYIVSPALGNRSGMLGAIALAKDLA
jgi:fructokinase